MTWEWIDQQTSQLELGLRCSWIANASEASSRHKRKSLWGRYHNSRLPISTKNFQTQSLAYEVNSHYSWILTSKFAYSLKCIIQKPIQTVLLQTCTELQNIWITQRPCSGWNPTRQHSAFLLQLSYWECPYTKHLVPHFSPFCAFC